MSLTVSVLLLLPVLNKKYVKPDVSENSTVGCVMCASGRLMRVTHFNLQVNVSVFVGRKHSSGEQEPSTLPSPPLLSAADDRSQVSSAGPGSVPSATATGGGSASGRQLEKHLDLHIAYFSEKLNHLHSSSMRCFCQPPSLIY